MHDIDWMNSPLDSFGRKPEFNDAGTTTGKYYYPHSDGIAQDIIDQLSYQIQNAYENFLEGYPEVLRYKRDGEVPVITPDGQREYRKFEKITLMDLPLILDRLLVLEAEQKERERVEAERKDTARKELARVRAKERRKRKKLGEW